MTERALESVPATGLASWACTGLMRTAISPTTSSNVRRIEAPFMSWALAWLFRQATPERIFLALCTLHLFRLMSSPGLADSAPRHGAAARRDSDGDRTGDQVLAFTQMAR